MRPSPTLLLATVLAVTPIAVNAAEVKPNFTLILTMSPAALSELTSMKEQVTVAAMYAGEPTKAGEKKAIEGEIGLGEEPVTRAVSALTSTWSFVGKGFSPAGLKWVKPGTAGVLINVYSARKASDDNLLDCGIFQGPLTEAAAQPIEISCKLIGE